MNRVRLGIAILLVLVLISGGTVWYVHQQTTRLLAQLDVLEDAIDNGPLEAAEEPFAEFERQWEKTEVLLNIMVWRERVSEIDVSVSHLDPMRVSDCDELRSEMTELRMRLVHLHAFEMPSWKNIL